MKKTKLKLVVSFDVTESQALTLMAMFQYWNVLSSMGGSRKVAFYCDGDGNFHPKCQFRTSRTIRELTPELKKSAIVSDDNGNRLYDFDSIAWKINS